MTPKQFLERMADPKLNMTKLAKLSGVHVRALRRLRNNPPTAPRQETIDAIGPFLMECMAERSVTVYHEDQPR